MAELMPMWSCSHCGPWPTSRANWCDRGCGSDYNRMERIDVLVSLAERDASENTPPDPTPTDTAHYDVPTTHPPHPVWPETPLVNPRFENTPYCGNPGDNPVNNTE